MIAHDFSWPFQKKATMETFRKNQPTAVTCSSFVILSGKLDNTVQMDCDDWNQLTAYANEVKTLESSPMKALDQDFWVGLIICSIGFVIIVVMGIFMIIARIVRSIGSIPLLLLIIVAVFVLFCCCRKATIKQHNSGIRKGDGVLHA